MAHDKSTKFIRHSAAYCIYRTRFYQRYVEPFKKSDPGRIKSLIPLREMAISIGVIEDKQGSDNLHNKRQ